VVNDSGAQFSCAHGNPLVAKGAILKLTLLPQRNVVGIRAFGSKTAVFFFFASSGTGIAPEL
jgi:hypothetical protein